MSRFTDGLTIREEGVDSDKWQIYSELVYAVGTEDSGVEIRVPVGFVSDGASIPWPISIIFPRWGRKYRRPAVVHDYLYRLGRASTPHEQGRTRRQADGVFYEAMDVTNVSLPIRGIFYLAVRLGARPWPGEGIFARFKL